MSLEKIAIIILAVIYVLSPIDVIPDIGFVGRIDDLLLCIYLYYRFKTWNRVVGGGAEEKPSGAQQRAGAPSEAKPRMPHEILGVSRNASAEEIQSAYRTLATQYHPDKVQHLGSDEIPTDFAVLIEHEIIVDENATVILPRRIHCLLRLARCGDIFLLIERDAIHHGLDCGDAIIFAMVGDDKRVVERVWGARH